MAVAASCANVPPAICLHEFHQIPNLQCRLLQSREIELC